MRDILIGFTRSLEMSGPFISLLRFLSQHNKDLECLTNYSSGRISRLLSHHSNDLRQQTGYSSSRQIFYLTDRIVHSLDVRTGQPQRVGHKPSWLPFLFSPSLLDSALCKIGFISTTSQERECKWAYTQGQLTVASYITTDSIVHIFPTTQSAIIRCMYI